MFTGLVARMGSVQSLRPEGQGRRLTLRADLFDESITVGESVAVNGVCLTVVEHRNAEAVFQLAPETLQRSNLGQLQTGDMVNLERSLRLGDRLGGHWVQGHVDGVVQFIRRQREGDWERFSFDLPFQLSRYVVAKGSITVNGVSLTVVDANESDFSVALIPHTLSVTNLGALQPGDRVNLEVDILGKYLERLTAHRMHEPETAGKKS